MLTTLFKAAPYIIGYVLLILLMMVVWRGIARLLTPRRDYGSLKTVTFGDESAVKANRVASVISVITVFWLWVAFTNSVIPLPKLPGPFSGYG